MNIEAAKALASSLTDLFFAVAFACGVAVWVGGGSFKEVGAGCAAFLLYLAILETRPRR